MKFRPILAAHILWLVILVPTGSPQNEPKKADTARFGNPTSTARMFQTYLYGVIKKIDTKNNQLVLDKTKFGVDQTIKLDAKTKFILDEKPSSLAHLKVGDQVYVDLKTDKKTGDMLAKKVVSGVEPTSLP